MPYLRLKLAFLTSWLHEVDKEISEQEGRVLDAAVHVRRAAAELAKRQADVREYSKEQAKRGARDGMRGSGSTPERSLGAIREGAAALAQRESGAARALAEAREKQEEAVGVLRRLLRMRDGWRSALRRVSAQLLLAASGGQARLSEADLSTVAANEAGRLGLDGSSGVTDGSGRGPIDENPLEGLDAGLSEGARLREEERSRLMRAMQEQAQVIACREGVETDCDGD